MGIWTKSVSGVMAAAMLAGMAAPAEARRGHHHHRSDKFTVGDAIGTLVVLGGIAAIASAASKQDDYGYGGSRYGYSGGSRGERGAVYTCVNEAEHGGEYGDARVRDITDVDKRDGVYRVRGVVDIGGFPDDGGIRAFTCYAKDGEIYNFEVNPYRF